jgi:hypothetical protein
MFTQSTSYFLDCGEVLLDNFVGAVCYFVPAEFPSCYVKYYRANSLIRFNGEYNDLEKFFSVPVMVQADIPVGEENFLEKV